MLPAGQVMHSNDEVFKYSPASQDMEQLYDISEDHVPNAQALQLYTESKLNVPAAQATQETVDMFKYCPAEQDDEQFADASKDQVPNEQGKHRV